MAKSLKFGRNLADAGFDGRGGTRCEAPGCEGPGEHRAPRSRENLRDYIWLCLDHVREYNASWDFYKGMSETEIETHKRRDSTWRRPSWPFGTSPGKGFSFRDPFGLFDDGNETGPPPPEPTPTERHALGVLELTAPATAEEIRARYMELVKELHPDANGGDKQAEERLKLINQAYTTLKSGDGNPTPKR